MSAYAAKVLGQGDPVIFLPGLGWSGSEGLNIAKYLADAYTVHLLDLPGLGRSQGIEGRVTWATLADWVMGYTQQHQLVRPSLIGHSLGGAVALAAACRYPSSVRRLILLDAAYRHAERFPREIEAPFRYLFPLFRACLKLTGPRFGALLLGRDQPHPPRSDAEVERAFAEIEHILKGLPDEQRHYVRAALRDPVTIRASGFATAMAAIYEIDPVSQLLIVQAPTLLIYGLRDDPTEGRAVRHAISEVQRKRPDIQLLAARGGHYVHWSDPHTTLEGIKAFLGNSANST